MAGLQANAYVLIQPRQPSELAKDISALANGGGGVLVIGYATSRDITTAQDLASSWASIPKALVDPEKYRGIIAAWTYPPISGVTFKWWLEEGTGAKEKGVLTIDVPAVSEADAPVLVTSYERESSGGLLIGLFSRSGDSVAAMRPSQLHTLLQFGRLAQRGGFEAPATPSPPGGPTEQERADRLTEDTRDVGLEGHRRYFLQAWPHEAVEMRELHERGDDGLRTILAWPAVLRSGGFGARTLDSVNVIAGGGVRVLANRWARSLQPDGLLTWVVTAGPEFLAWADQGRGHPLSINSLTLVESTLEFARLFINQILPHCDPSPEQWAIAGGMADLDEDGATPSLARGTPQEGFFTGFQAAPSPGFTFGPVVQRGTPPGVVAFDILKRIYRHFGLPESAIPYARDGAIDEDVLGRE